MPQTPNRRTPLPRRSREIHRRTPLPCGSRDIQESPMSTSYPFRSGSHHSNTSVDWGLLPAEWVWFHFSTSVQTPLVEIWPCFPCKNVDNSLGVWVGGYSSSSPGIAAITPGRTSVQAAGLWGGFFFSHDSAPASGSEHWYSMGAWTYWPHVFCVCCHCPSCLWPPRNPTPHPCCCLVQLGQGWGTWAWLALLCLARLCLHFWFWEAACFWLLKTMSQYFWFSQSSIITSKVLIAFCVFSALGAPWLSSHDHIVFQAQAHCPIVTIMSPSLSAWRRGNGWPSSRLDGWFHSCLSALSLISM